MHCLRSPAATLRSKKAYVSKRQRRNDQNAQQKRNDREHSHALFVLPDQIEGSANGCDGLLRRTGVQGGGRFIDFNDIGWQIWCETRVGLCPVQRPGEIDWNNSAPSFAENLNLVNNRIRPNGCRRSHQYQLAGVPKRPSADLLPVVSRGITRRDPERPGSHRPSTEKRGRWHRLLHRSKNTI